MKIKLKRMTSLMLAVLMVCGMFPMPSFAAEKEANLTPLSVIYDANGKVKETANKNEQLGDGQVILTKEAKTTGVPNQYEITLTVRGKGAKASAPGADIVLVMDKSGSMKAAGMAALKNAAEAFIDIVLADGKSNRVSLVDYSTDASTATEFYTSAQRTEAKREIPTDPDGGTNTQMGLYMARAKLAESKATKKFVVLISDGEPTFNAIPIINAQWTGNRSGSKTNYNTCSYSGYGDFRWYGTSGSGRWEKAANGKDINDIVGYDYTMYTGDGGDSYYNGYVLGTLKSDPTKTVVNGTKRTISSATAAIDEAGYIKATGTEIYTVAYNADYAARNVLSSIASNAKGKTYTYNTSSDLTNVFKSIGESIEQEVSGGVTDPMGSFIDIGTPTVSGTLSNKGNYKVSNGTIRFEGDTFTWAPNVSETASTLSYIVELDVEAEGFVENKVYDTNGITTMEYKIGETQKTGQFNVPSVKGTYSQIYRIGYRVNENDQYIDENGNVVDKEKAVIFAQEAVGNPHAEGRNQWKIGRNAVVNAFDGGKNYELVSDHAVNFTTDGASDYVAEFNYVVKQYDYTVKYYVDGEYQSKWDENGKAIYNAVIETYENKCPAGYKLEKTENLPLTIEDGENVIKVYYVKDNFSYTVNYYKDSKNNDPFKTEGKDAQFGTKIPYYVAENVPEGYKTDAAVENANGTVTEDPAKNIVNIIYTKRNDLSYVVNYLEQGSNAVLADQKVVGNKTFGAVVTEEAIEIAGYNKVAPTSETITIKVEGNVINFWYNKRTDLSYTVNYLEQGTDKVLADPKVVTNQEYGKKVTENAIEIDGYNKVAPTSADITLDKENQVINFYYTKKADLSYIVKYLEVGTRNELHASKTVNNQTFGDEVTEEAVAITGYNLQSEAQQSITITTGENEIIFWYAKKGDLTYIVNYYEKGTENKVADSKTVNNQTFGAVVTENAIDVEGYVKVEPTTATITIAETGNIINFYYNKRTDLSYEVNYLEKGSNAVLADQKVVGNKTFGAVVTENAIDIAGYDKVAPVSETITIKVEGNVINFYYNKKTNLTYVVNYLEQGTNVALAAQRTVGNQTFGEEVTEEAINIAGYDKVAPTSATITIVDGDNVINFYYNKKTDLTYVVNYLEQGSNAVLADQKVVDGKTFGAVVTESAINIAGYDKVAPTSETITIIDGDNVINFYYNKRTDLSYTVNYYEEGTENKVADSKVVTGQTYKAIVNEEAIDVFGYNKAGETAKSITIELENNVINFYYNKRTDLQYTVRYLEEDTEIELHEEKAVTGKTYMSEVTENAVIIDGYVAVGETNQTITLDKDNKVITFWYNKRNDLGYTVKYLEKDTNKVLADNKVVDGKTLGEVISEEAIEITGYNKVEPTTGTVTITTGTNEIVFLYEKASFAYTVKYYYDGVCDEEKTETGTAKFEDVISQYTDKVIEGYVFQTKENMPLTVTADESENVAHIYYVKRADLGYTVKYLEKDTFEALAQDKTGSGKTFDEYVTENAIAITGYKLAEGEAVEKSITITTGDNEIVFLYEKDSYPYVVNYYKDSVDEGNLLGTSTGASKLYGTQLDEAMVTADLREGWLNAFLPAGYLETTVIDGEYPVIDIENNVINVVYRRNDNLQYTVKYYKDAAIDENLLGADVTNGVTLGDMVFADNGPVPMAMISLYTFEVFKYLPAGYAEEADIENAPLTVGANVNENVIIVVYKARENASLTINKTVADIENETAGTTFFFKVTSDKLEAPMYVSAVIEEIDGVKTIAPVVIDDLEWGKYTVTEVIYNDGEYIEDLTRFDYTVSGTGDVHVGGENIEANIDIINTRREGGSLVISKVASGAFNPDTVYEFALYLSHMRYNEVTEGEIEEATALLETLKAALLQAETLRDTKKAEYDAIMAEVVNAEANLALAKAPIEKATLDLELAKADKLTAEEMLEVMTAQLAEAQAKEAPEVVAEAAEPTEIVEEPTAPVEPAVPTAPTVPVAPTAPTNPGEFTGTAPNPPSQPTVEEGADEETIANALADYETAYAAYETALTEFENAKAAHEAALAQYNAEMTEFNAYDAQAAEEAYQAALAEYAIALAEYEPLKAQYDLDLAAYTTAKAAFDAYTEQLEAFEAYTAYLAELEAFTLLQEETIPQLETQIAEMTAALEAKTAAVADAETALETAEAESAEVIAAAQLALENAKTLASENGSEEALAALETAEKAVVDAQNAVAEAEEALRHLMSANDPTKRSADEVILVDNEMLTPIVENDITVGYTFTLKSGESLMLTDLPADAVYEVIEIDNGGADETYIGEVMTSEESGLIDTENGSVVAFTNVFIPDKTITVTKSYEGNVYNGTVVIDIFRVTEEGDELVDTVRITGNGSETVIVEELGEYKAVERDVDNYIPSYGENAVLTEDNINGTLTVTNTYDPPYVPDPPQPPVNDNYYKVTVIYINEETGEELIGRYTTGSILEGSEYDVTGETMVEIEGFDQTGVEGETSGILNEDVTVIVYYAPAEEIIEEEVPLDPPAEEEIIEEEIIEEEIPLIDLPKTGGASGIGFCMIGVAALAAGFMLRSKEEDEE